MQSSYWHSQPYVGYVADMLFYKLGNHTKLLFGVNSLLAECCSGRSSPCALEVVKIKIKGREAPEKQQEL